MVRKPASPGSGTLVLFPACVNLSTDLLSRATLNFRQLPSTTTTFSIPPSAYAVLLVLSFSPIVFRSSFPPVASFFAPSLHFGCRPASKRISAPQPTHYLFFSAAFLTLTDLAFSSRSRQSVIPCLAASFSTATPVLTNSPSSSTIGTPK